MFIYNVTVKIDLSVHEDWLNWMKSTHIPDVIHTGYFKEYRIMRILEQDESDGITYAIQYFADSMNRIKEYQEQAAKVLQEEHTRRYKDKFVAFRTMMEVMD